MPKKFTTQATRTLDARKINYTVHLFPDTLHDAEEVAAALQKPSAQVFKTLVLLREDNNTTRPLLVMVPASSEIDLRKFAASINVKSVRMATYEQAEKLTGLKVGGISALALLNRSFDVYLDAHATTFTNILISGGQRGVDLELAVTDLLALTSAQLIDATRPRS